MQESQPTAPILLFNDECGVCRRIARWVNRSTQRATGSRGIVERPIGDDPEALRTLNPELNIWDAYATIHLLMPDGSMKLGGEAVAEVFRRLPNTRWFAWLFAIRILGWRPFQMILNTGYAILSAVRPVFGCESCGTPRPWLRPFTWIKRVAETIFGRGSRRHTPASRHASPRAPRTRPAPATRQAPV